MNIDLSALMKSVEEDIEANGSSNGGNGNGYPLVYPGKAGKITFRLLYNIKSNSVQRRVMRHGKTACLGMYGEECPVCKAIKEAEETKGKDCGAFNKYGYKTRGICYAKIVDVDSSYSDIHKGDTVLLMYSKGVYEAINKSIVDAGANLAKLVSYNEGIPFVLENTGKGGKEMYNLILFPYGAVKVFDEPDGDKKFDELLESLPSLSEALCPMHPDEELRKNLRAMAETVTQEYIYGNVINPGDKVDNSPTDSKKEEGQSVNPVFNQGQTTSNPAPTESAPNNANAGGNPECFGNHNEGDNKCLMCPVEAECFLKSSK